MDRDQTAAQESSSDDIARLTALAERQHELWILLRDAPDEESRNRFFDELAANRVELNRLRDMVGTDLDPTVSVVTPQPPAPPPPGLGRSIGEELRAKILTPADDVASEPSRQSPRASPPAREPAPSASADRGSPDALRTAAEKPAADAGTPPSTEPDITERPAPGLAPEKVPFSSREADLAATQANAPKRKRSSPRSATTPSARAAYRELERVRPKYPRPFPVFAVLVAISAVALVVWFLFFFSTGNAPETQPNNPATTAAPSGDETPDPAEQIRAVFGGLGLTGVTVEERAGTLFLAGVVGSADERTAAIGAAVALAGGVPVNDADLTVGLADEAVQAAARQAITAAGYDQTEVAVADGVATLTGVTPGEGIAHVVAVVADVEGVSQVVDLTESPDSAPDLEAELERITATTPLVFASGQMALDPFQEQILDGVAEVILGNEGAVIIIAAYTDAAGAEAEKQEISQARAEIVKSYLVELGVPTERLLAEGRGELAAGSLVAGEERRVEFEVGGQAGAGDDGAPDTNALGPGVDSGAT